MPGMTFRYVMQWNDYYPFKIVYFACSRTVAKIT